MAKQSKKQGAQITSRQLRRGRLDDEFRAVATFLTRHGVLGIDSRWFQSVGRAAWQKRNPQVYRVYERAKTIVGFLGLAPIRFECAADLLAGRRDLWWNVRAEDILDPVTAARARWFGSVMVIDAYTHEDEPGIEQQMRGDLLRELSQTHVGCLLAHSSTERSEAACKAIGMRSISEGPVAQSGTIRRLWCARELDFSWENRWSTPEQPLLWYVFDQIRSRFTLPAGGLHLTEQAQWIAYLYYLEGLDEQEVASQLGMKPAVVHEYLARIRDRAEYLLGGQTGGTPSLMPRNKSAMAAYLADHPGEIQAAAILFKHRFVTRPGDCLSF